MQGQPKHIALKNVLGVEIPAQIEYYNTLSGKMELAESVDINIQAKADNLTIEIDGIIGFGDTWFPQFKKKVNAAKPKHIDLVLSSYGGYLDDGVKIHDFLLSLDATVTAYYMGSPASATTIIGSAASNIYASENANILFHRPWGIAVGDFEALNARAEQSKLFNTTVCNIYKSAAGKRGVDLSITEIDKLLKKDTYINPETAKKYGLIDGIVKPEEIKANSPKNTKTNIENKTKANNMANLNEQENSFLSGLLAKLWGDDGKAVKENPSPETDALSDLQGTVNDLSATMANLQTELQALKAANGTLSTENESLKQSNEAAKKEAEELQAKNQDLTDKMNAATGVASGTSTALDVSSDDTLQKLNNHVIKTLNL